MIKNKLLICILIYLNIVLFLYTGCSELIVGENPSNDPISNFEHFWNEFDRHYSYFELKNVDWDSVYSVYRPQIIPSLTDKELFDTFSEVSLLLQDGHVSLESSRFGIVLYQGFFRDRPRNFIPSALNTYINGLTTNPPFQYGRISDKTAYIRISTFGSFREEFVDFEEILNSFGNIENLIIDLRDNMGGINKNAAFIAGHFTENDYEYGRFRFRNGPSYSDFTDWRDLEIESVTNSPFRGNVYLLTNRRCFSSTEDFIMAMKQLPNITQIGDTTGGGMGNPINKELPNGWIVRISHWQQVDLQFRNFEGRGFAPDVPVWITQSDSLNGRDTILEAALSLTD